MKTTPRGHGEFSVRSRISRHISLSHTRGHPLIQTHYRGSWVEIVEVGMVGSGIIKEGAVLSWEGIQYCGTPGFKVCVCCECVCDVLLPRTQVLDFCNSLKSCIPMHLCYSVNFCAHTELYTAHTVHTHKHTHNRPIGRCPRWELTEFTKPPC